MVLDVDSCDAKLVEESSVGSRYISAAEASDGVVRDICGEDFSTLITDLSLNTSRLRDTYYLSSPPDVSTLVVLIDDEEQSCEDGTWNYEWAEYLGEQTGAIVFEAGHMPPINSKITVRYNAGTGDSSLFCTDSGAEG